MQTQPPKSITPERWRRIEDLYHAARGRTSADSAVFLAEACGGDADLRREVESLLAEDGSRADMLERPALPADSAKTGAGSQFGPYRIEASIGKGGMGEVWKARDSRLNRDVAIKISAQQFTGRFEREARAIAALNHPNICTLYDIGPNYLVMELVEGPTLAERIKRGPIPVDEALNIAKQIADALEAAHDKGIVHRDLKPANIKIRPDGSVKVLDFGLAKTSGEEAGISPDSQTMAMTAPGAIMGTPGYMPPEQVRGEKVNKRADIWAFGVVLYEMVTGERPFDGKTTSDTLAAVIKEDPDWAQAPVRTRRVLRACLEKDPRRRLRDIGDVERLLDVEEAPTAPTRSRFGIAGWIAAAALLVAIPVVWWLKPAPPATHVVARFRYPLPEGQQFTRQGHHVLAISPDGTKLVYIANQRLYLRAMDQLEAQPVRGADEDPMEPIFSPDGQWLAYFAPVDGAGASFTTPWLLRKIPAAGGAPVTLGQLTAAPFGETWRNGTIAFGVNAGGVSAIQTLPDSGGVIQTIVTADRTKEHVAQPQLLADGKHVLFVSVPAGLGSEGQIVVQSLDGKDRRTLVSGGTNPHVLPTGQLIYIRDGTLLAVPFDINRVAVTGGPVLIEEGVNETSGKEVGQFAVSSDGTLAFWPAVLSVAARAQSTLVWVDRQGHEQLIPARPRAYTDPRLSPDGTKIAVSSDDEEHDIWVFDLAKETLTPLTFGPAFERQPVWTPDGKYLLVGSGPAKDSQADIFRKASDGTGPIEALTRSLGGGYPLSMSPHGNSLVFRRNTPKGGLFVLPLEPKGEPRSLLADPIFDATKGEISPDGRWIAYQSDESGRWEILVRPFPAVDGGRWQISPEGGYAPLWSRSGRELFFTTLGGNRLATVSIQAGSGFTYSRPQTLFDISAYAPGSLGYDVSPDGKRFLVVKPLTNDATSHPSIVVVTHWFDEVKARMPAR